MSPAIRIIITVGAPVTGNAGTSCGTTGVSVTTGGVIGTTGVGVVGFGVTVAVFVAAITALGLAGALRTIPGILRGTVNSRIESTQALIVWFVSDKAEVIVSTYDAPGVNGEAVIIVATDLLLLPVIDAILTLSLVA